MLYTVFVLLNWLCINSSFYFDDSTVNQKRFPDEKRGYRKYSVKHEQMSGQ